MACTKGSEYRSSYKFLVSFPNAGGREGKEGAKGAAAARPTEFREVPRPLRSREAGPEPPDLEAAEGSVNAPARGLNLSAVEGPWPAATLAGTPLGVPNPNAHHGCGGDGSQPRTWQLPAAPRTAHFRRRAGRPGCSVGPPGSKALRSHKGSGPFRGSAPPSSGPSPLREERARPTESPVSKAFGIWSSSRSSLLNSPTPPPPEILG